MTGRIDLSGIEVDARHGVLESEKSNSQLFKVDVSAYLDLNPAVNSDDLPDTLDYGALAEQVHEIVANESHQLIETVADRVASHVMSDDRVTKVVVTVHKPEAPIEVPFSDVAVTIERTR